ncbi:MAG: mechanosensitive ion channel family protein [Acidimicrobiia bacterium]|nr:mechanosensitive ion channel family protein [Acidimicrobiia bacterium]
MTDTVARLVATAIVLAATAVLLGLAGRFAGWWLEDPYARFHARKLTRYAISLLALIALAVVWRSLAGNVGVILGFAAAGIAFAMQEVIGAIAGWFNVTSGRIYRIGDRIELGGVRGDVIDITLLRTKMLEIGSAEDDNSWVKGRQHTGRIVAVSNKSTFTSPVYNFSAIFEFIWEELTVPISYRSDWHEAERIIKEEAVRASASEGARAAVTAMERRYPIPHAEVEPRVFVRATDNWMELAARFVVPVRKARTAKDTMMRRIRERLDDAGIEIASETEEVTVSYRGGNGDGDHSDSASSSLRPSPAPGGEP